MDDLFILLFYQSNILDMVQCKYRAFHFVRLLKSSLSRQGKHVSLELFHQLPLFAL